MLRLLFFATATVGTKSNATGGIMKKYVVGRQREARLLFCSFLLEEQNVCVCDGPVTVMRNGLS
jgi:hypothetical protein